MFSVPIDRSFFSGVRLNTLSFTRDIKKKTLAKAAAGGRWRGARMVKIWERLIQIKAFYLKCGPSIIVLTKFYVQC